ncbi:hypothetical protein GF337_04910 [candidate division KSB1 bacterium]|nr:hypothetical protein [candidate division KSB1 bacterium]
MKKLFNIILILFFLIILTSGSDLFGQTVEDSSRVAPIGYADADKDGVNDLFHDANGDGVNDVTHKRYRHHFRWQDEDDDGVNDLWRDQDGDGVNDLLQQVLKKRGIKPKIPWIDRDGDGIRDAAVVPTFDADLKEFVLDMDGDSVNDITGVGSSKSNSMGYRFGRIDEEMNQKIEKFIDKNNDGMFDNFSNRLKNDMKKFGHLRKFDYFIDKDGDGISDGRGFKRMGRKQPGQGHGRGKGP